MPKVEYDFLNWTSFPSSIKIMNDRNTPFYHVIRRNLPLKGLGAEIKIVVAGKTENVRLPPKGVYPRNSYVGLYADGLEHWTGMGVFDFYGTRDWEVHSATFTIGKYPATPNVDYRLVNVVLGVPMASPEEPSITWFDDLKIYQDGKLIYDNYFTVFRPGRIIPVVVTPPEVLVRAWQRRKQERTGGTVLKRPLAVVV